MERWKLNASVELYKNSTLYLHSKRQLIKGHIKKMMIKGMGQSKYKRGEKIRKKGSRNKRQGGKKEEEGIGSIKKKIHL